MKFVMVFGNAKRIEAMKFKVKQLELSVSEIWELHLLKSFKASR